MEQAVDRCRRATLLVSAVTGAAIATSGYLQGSDGVNAAAVTSASGGVQNFT